MIVHRIGAVALCAVMNGDRVLVRRHLAAFTSDQPLYPTALLDILRNELAAGQ